jgi:signal peptidase
MTAVLLNRRPGAAPLLPPAGTGRVAVTAPRRSAGSRRALAAAYRWMARLIMVVAVLAFAGLAVGPHALGYRTMTMLTGSMAPQINPGDVVVATPVAVGDITEGMIISYHIPVGDHHVESHRVVSVEHGSDGRVTIQTKGDANAEADPWKATLQGDTAYQVRAVVPWVGTAIEVLRTPVVTQALVYGAPALLAGWLILAIWRPATETTDQTDERDEEDRS